MTTWLDAIDANGFNGEVRTMMIREAHRTRFPGDLPAGFAFLRGPFLHLGFDRLGLTAADLDAVLLAFIDTGVRVPGTNFRVRYVRPVLSVVELASGDEMSELSDRWRRCFAALATDAGYASCGVS